MGSGSVDYRTHGHGAKILVVTQAISGPCPALLSFFPPTQQQQRLAWWPQYYSLWRWGSTLASPSPGAAWRVCHQCGGVNIVCKTQNLYFYFYSILASLVIKTHPRNCTDSWILFPCPIFINIYKFTPNIYHNISTLIFNIYSSANLLLLYLWCLIM